MLSLSLAWAPRGSSRSRNAAQPEEMSSSRCSQMIHWLRIRGIIKWTQFLCAKDYLDLGLTGLHRRVRLDMHCKVEKKGVDPMSISPNNLSSDELCFVDIAPRMTWFIFFYQSVSCEGFRYTWPKSTDESVPGETAGIKPNTRSNLQLSTIYQVYSTRWTQFDQMNNWITVSE